MLPGGSAIGGSKLNVAHRCPDPKLAATARRENWLTGDMPSPYDRPKGCAFHNRCPFRGKRCEADVPPLRKMDNGDWVACHRAEDLDLSIEEDG